MNRTALSTGSTSRRLPALLFVLLLGLVAQTIGRPSADDDSDLAIIPPDSDNVEIHNVKFVNGVMQKDHPVIMYKEDFVSEDYDPTKNETGPVRHKKHKRTHHHRAGQQLEKEGDQILFDILPDKPIVLEEDLRALPESKVEAAQLAEPIKEEWLGKHPKKYHSRQRRQINGVPKEYVLQYNSHQIQAQPYLVYYRPAVWGKQPVLKGPIHRYPDNQDNNQVHDNDQDQGKPGTNQVNQGTVVDSRGDFDLIHDSDQSNADFSVYNQTTTPRSIFQIQDTERVQGTIRPPTFLPNRPTFLPNRPPTRSPVVGLPTLSPNKRPSPPNEMTDQASEPKVSKCVWAIVNCCTSESKKVRYNCFEEFGCHGAFWDINPCADDGVKQAELAPLFGASLPEFALPPRRPSSRKDALQFPEDFEYQEGSNCQRASKVCCSQRNLGSQYDCFLHHGCSESIATIISTCS